MEHIGDILRGENYSLFANASEKGSGEWSFGPAVQGDKQPGIFRVASHPERAALPSATAAAIQKFRDVQRLSPRSI